MRIGGVLSRMQKRRLDRIARRLGWRTDGERADVERFEREAPLFDMGEVQYVRAFFPDATDADRPRH